jgi:hypothetical protein
MNGRPLGLRPGYQGITKCNRSSPLDGRRSVQLATEVRVGASDKGYCDLVIGI